jgi:Cu/Ag efflux protein CusF
MGVMTVGYSVTSQELTKGFKPGDSVKFRIDAAKQQIVAIEQQAN